MKLSYLRFKNLKTLLRSGDGSIGFINLEIGKIKQNLKIEFPTFTLNSRFHLTYSFSGVRWLLTDRTATQRPRHEQSKGWRGRSPFTGLTSMFQNIALLRHFPRQRDFLLLLSIIFISFVKSSFCVTVVLRLLHLVRKDFPLVANHPKIVTQKALGKKATAKQFLPPYWRINGRERRWNF